MSAGWNIILGVVSGILTAFAISLFLSLLKRIVIPWLEDLIYKDVDISGLWVEKYTPLIEGEEEEKQTQSITLDLKQKARSITGVSFMTDTDEASQRIGMRIMKVSGYVRNRYVSIDLDLDNRKGFGIVNYLLEVTSEGKIMEGFTTYYNPTTKKLSCAKCILDRQDDPLMVSRESQMLTSSGSATQGDK